MRTGAAVGRRYANLRFSGPGVRRQQRRLLFTGRTIRGRLARSCVEFEVIADLEHDLLIDGYIHNAVEFKTKGAPVDFVFTNPTIVKPPSVIAITAKAARPHSAALLLDYHLSKEAQEIMAHKQSRWTTRADIKWLTEPGTKIHVVSPLKWALRYNDVVALFRKITA